MRSVTFKSVWRQVLRRCGLDPDDGTMTDARKEFFADLINGRIRLATEYAFWPELIATEQRTPVSGLIAYDQSGQTELGEVLSITNFDPNTHDEVISYAFVPMATGVQINDEASPATVYVTFRRRPQVFTTEAFDGNTAYNEGDLVLAADGCVWQVTITNNSYGWTRIDFPYIFERYAVLGATADYLAQDGQLEKSALEEARAQEELVAAHTRAFRQQGQCMRAQVVVD